MLQQSHIQARRASIQSSGLQNETDPIARMGTQIRYSRNEEIHGEGEPAEFLYKVMSGTVRTYKILADGRRQIGAFYLPGDIFGLEASEEHAFSAEAVTESTVLVVKRSAIMDLARRDRAVAQSLWTETGRELQRTQAHVLLLIKAADERVAGFLTDMARREGNQTNIQLAMSRQGIADYLGLTIETISRTFSQFEKSAVIALPSSRCIEIKDRAALLRLDS